MPDHVPGAPTSVWPTVAVPLVVGAVTVRGPWGATVGGVAGAGATTDVAADEELVEPHLFLAKTTTRIVEPTSPVPRRYVGELSLR